MKVKFFPQDVEAEIRPNQTVLQLAQEMDIHIKSVCKGLPSCAECRVRVTEGEHNVMPPSTKELNLIGTSYFIDQRRLSCQLRCFGDVTVDLTEQVEKAENAVVKKPRGNVRRTEGESQAVSGSIVLDEMTATNTQNMEDVNERRANSALEREQRQRRTQREETKASFYNEWKEEVPNTRNNQNRNQRHGQGQRRGQGQQGGGNRPNPNQQQSRPGGPQRGQQQPQRQGKPNGPRKPR